MNPSFEKHLWMAVSENQCLSNKLTEGRWFLAYPFKPFSILNFAITELFCHVTCFAKNFLLLFFFSHIFFTKKLFYNTHQSEVLPFLHRWVCCWKCEFDTDVKIENYYHYVEEQLIKVHSKVWDNFWRLKVLQKWWEMFFISP